MLPQMLPFALFKCSGDRIFVTEIFKNGWGKKKDREKEGGGRYF
jgi:hypothetical protein